MQKNKDLQPQNFSDLLGFEILQKDQEKCIVKMEIHQRHLQGCLLYTSPSPRDRG